jgi:hypothetical protein
MLRRDLGLFWPGTKKGNFDQMNIRKIMTLSALVGALALTACKSGGEAAPADGAAKPAETAPAEGGSAAPAEGAPAEGGAPAGGGTEAAATP